MTLFKWFTRTNNDELPNVADVPIPLPVEAELPDDKHRSRLDEFSPTWRYIRTWAEAEADRLRRRNDSPRLDDKDTTLIRGQLKMLKGLLDLPNAGRDNRPGSQPPV